MLPASRAKRATFASLFALPFLWLAGSAPPVLAAPVFMADNFGQFDVWPPSLFEHRHHHHNNNFICMSDREILRYVADQDYTKAKVFDDRGNGIVEVHATQGNWIYGLLVDTCDREIVKRTNLYRVRPKLN